MTKYYLAQVTAVKLSIIVVPVCVSKSVGCAVGGTWGEEQYVNSVVSS
jgi:hypothetical protein